VRVVATLILVVSMGCQSGPPNLDRDGDGVTRVACFGDSNTTDAKGPSWCNLLGEEFPMWVMSNRSSFGMTIVDTGATYGGFDLAARPHLDEILTIDHPDVVILAFGTNDFFRGAKPQAIVDAYAEAKARIERVGGRCLVALTPPTQPPQSPGLDEAIRDLNARLAKAFPGEIVDFWTGMTAADYKPDGLHVNASGQVKRAAAARRALLR